MGVAYNIIVFLLLAGAYFIGKFAFMIAFIVNVAKNNKKNKTDKKSVVLGRYYIFLAIVIYVLSILVDYMVNAIYLASWSLLYLIHAFKSKGEKIKSKATTIILIVSIIYMLLANGFVSFGIFRYIEGPTSTVFPQAQIEAHNSNYEAYFGEKKRTSEVRALLQKIKTNNALYSMHIDDGIDNDHSEIIIDQEKIKFENIRCFAPVANAKSNAMEQIKYIGPKPLNNTEEMNWLAGTIRLWAEKIPDINVSDIERFLIQAGFSEEYARVEGRQRANKFVFEMSMFPFLYRSYISRDEINGYYLGALCCNARQFFMADREFCRWAKDDCSVEGYDAVFNKIRNLVVEDEEMLKMAADQKKIYPNEPCPCGSGKKYKRCHGRFC